MTAQDHAPTVAIAGAGLGGLAAALALQRQGIAVAVYEQAAELGEVGAGITLHPNAVKALAWLGLADEIAATGVVVARNAIKHWQTGAILVAQEKGDETIRKFGAPLIQTHRADVHRALEQAVRRNDPGCIRVSHGLKDFRETADDVELTFANGTTARNGILIGADGIKSVVRARAFSPEPPRFMGRVSWRGVVPRARVPDAALQPGSAILIGPGATFGYYLMRAGTLVNYVATVTTDIWTEEGWSIPSTIDEVLVHFPGWHADVAAIIGATPPGACFKWALFAHAPLKGWTQGRIALLGDAAHPMLPFMGQGAAQAIEDGVILARCLIAEPDPVAALRRYERARIARATFIQLESTAKAERWESRDTDAYRGQKHRNEDEMGVFDYDAGTAAI
ncbi:MAG: FAD-dependent monooxygenase [Rhodospirillaceae bacterium]|nr:FAD-dependent monooxygenase [Rhodospirillaceae bacterium]